jgi:hypothetical protein
VRSMAAPVEDRAAERPAHPLARELWKLLRNRSEADRRLVYEALQRRLGIGEMTAKREQAAEALRRFVSAQREARTQADPPSWALGEPSRRRYEKFRSESPDRAEWPSVQFIRNAFSGSFSAGLEAIGEQPAVDVLSRRLTACGKHYTREEVLDVLRAWIEHVDREQGPNAALMQPDYLRWRDDLLRSSAARAARYPTLPVIYNLIGSWPEALSTLGHQHRSTPGYRPEKPRESEPAAGFDFNSAPAPMLRADGRSRNRSHSSQSRKEDLIAWLRWVAEQLRPEEAEALTYSQYNRLCASVARVSLAQGNLARPPAAAQFVKCPEIGSWPRAKYLAGLIDEDVLARSHSAQPYSELELVKALVEAVAEVGPDISRASYATWREQRLAEARGEERIPSDALLRQRLGNDSGAWAAVLSNCLKRAAKLGIAAPEEQAR